LAPAKLAASLVGFIMAGKPNREKEVMRPSPGSTLRAATVVPAIRVSKAVNFTHRRLAVTRFHRRRSGAAPSIKAAPHNEAI
jgi:hypothetical protein